MIAAVFFIKVEVPVTLGDYDSPEELLKRLSETKRVRGKPRLAAALEEAYSEFSVSSTPEQEKAIIIFSNGPFRYRFTLDIVTKF